MAYGPFSGKLESYVFKVARGLFNIGLRILVVKMSSVLVRGYWFGFELSWVELLEGGRLWRRLSNNSGKVSGIYRALGYDISVWVFYDFPPMVGARNDVQWRSLLYRCPCRLMRCCTLGVFRPSFTCRIATGLFSVVGKKGSWSASNCSRMSGDCARARVEVGWVAEYVVSKTLWECRMQCVSYRLYLFLCGKLGFWATISNVLPFR